jgi:CRISPR/Cas system-associated protein Cas10 (large subunit of type III CRISPR-Cas system)
MAEPQPPTIQEGIDPEGPPPLTGTDARKAAAALSSLDARGDEDETAQSSTVKNIDQEALVNAISRLELTSGKVTPGGEEQKKREAERKRERERRAKVKVDVVDVGLLVSRAVDRSVGEGGAIGVVANVVIECRLRNWS